MKQHKPVVGPPQPRTRSGGSRGASPPPSDRPINRTFGPEGEVPNDGAEEDATAEWLAHVQAGRIGAP